MMTRIGHSTYLGERGVPKPGPEGPCLLIFIPANLFQKVTENTFESFHNFVFKQILTQHGLISIAMSLNSFFTNGLVPAIRCPDF